MVKHTHTPKDSHIQTTQMSDSLECCGCKTIGQLASCCSLFLFHVHLSTLRLVSILDHCQGFSEVYLSIVTCQCEEFEVRQAENEQVETVDSVQILLLLLLLLLLLMLEKRKGERWSKHESDLPSTEPYPPSSSSHSSPPSPHITDRQEDEEEKQEDWVTFSQDWMSMDWCSFNFCCSVFIARLLEAIKL